MKDWTQLEIGLYFGPCEINYLFWAIDYDLELHFGQGYVGGKRVFYPSEYLWLCGLDLELN